MGCRTRLCADGEQVAGLAEPIVGATQRDAVTQP
jgi:hypothetical protein